MPIISRWHIEKRVIHIQITDTLNHDDVMAAAQEAESLIEEGEAPVHIIVEVVDLDETRVKARAAIDATAYLNRARVGTVIVVGVTVVVNFLLSIIESVFFKRFKRAESVEEALNILRELDDSLPD